MNNKKRHQYIKEWCAGDDICDHCGSVTGKPKTIEIVVCPKCLCKIEYTKAQVDDTMELKYHDR